jgi:hypothetical protein
MPSNWLSVPHFQQELEYSRVAVCARMVLAHFGQICDEAELRTLFLKGVNLLLDSGVTLEHALRPIFGG